jgi:hypothetical protein
MTSSCCRESRLQRERWTGVVVISIGVTASPAAERGQECHMTWVAGHRMINILLPDRGGSDHFLDFPILSVSGTEFVEIENKLGALPEQVNK